MWSPLKNNLPWESWFLPCLCMPNKNDSNWLQYSGSAHNFNRFAKHATRWLYPTDWCHPNTNSVRVTQKIKGLQASVFDCDYNYFIQPPLTPIKYLEDKEAKTCVSVKCTIVRLDDLEDCQKQKTKKWIQNRNEAVWISLWGEKTTKAIWLLEGHTVSVNLCAVVHIEMKFI